MPEGVTNQGEDKKLGDALDGELLVSVADREEPPVNPGNTHAEGAGRRRCQGRNVVRDGPLVEMEEALVAGGDEGLHVSIGRERPGRYPFGLRVVAGEGIVVHVHQDCDVETPAFRPGRKRRSTSPGISVRSDTFRLSARVRRAPAPPGAEPRPGMPWLRG